MSQQDSETPNVCEHCGSNRMYFGPPNCPYCGAPNCCQTCCKITRLESQLTAAQAGLTELGNELFDCKAQLKDSDDRNAALKAERDEVRALLQNQQDNYGRIYDAVMGDGTITAEWLDPADAVRQLRAERDALKDDKLLMLGQIEYLRDALSRVNRKG
jgi:chromosome segregation ATPase